MLMFILILLGIELFFALIGMLFRIGFRLWPLWLLMLLFRRRDRYYY